MPYFDNPQYQCPKCGARSDEIKKTDSEKVVLAVCGICGEEWTEEKVTPGKKVWLHG